MGKTVKLPLLPGTEPEGDMAKYLAQVRLKQQEDQQVEATPKEATQKESTPEEPTPVIQVVAIGENSKDEFTLDGSLPYTTPQFGLDEFTTKSSDNTADAGSANPFLERNGPDSVTESNEEMYKILDKSTVELPPIPVERVTSNVIITNAIDGKAGPPASRNSRVKSHLKKESLPKASLGIVNYLNSMPQAYTNSFFAKGEMKIRVSADIADLLRLLHDCSDRLEHPQYLADNLVNQLLIDFFIRYASDVETLSVENQQLQRSRHQSKLSILLSRDSVDKLKT